MFVFLLSFKFDSSFFFQFYYAAYSFEARNSNELSLFEGQVVTVLNKHDQENNPEWWFVDADGVKGYAPANYLRPMR